MKVPVGSTYNCETKESVFRYVECTEDQFTEAMIRILAPAFPGVFKNVEVPDLQDFA